MGKIRTGFKVVRRMNYFEVASAFNLGKVVEYSTNYWTNRPSYCGPLSVFGRLKDAEFFLKKENNKALELYLCEYEESSRRELYTENKRWKEVWCPSGTDFAEKIKLLQKIHKF